MARETYGIRTGLDKGRGDTEISVASNDGLGLRPLPVRFLLMYIASLLVWFWVVSQTFMRNAGPGVIVAFSVLWGLLSVFLLQRDDSGEPKFHLVNAMFDYLPHRLRHVRTRGDSAALSFATISGIDFVEFNVDGEAECVHWLDGTVSYVYAVVGYASRLLFESDRHAVIDAVSAFWRDVPEDVEWVFVTNRGPQDVSTQLAHMEARRQALLSSGEVDPDIVGCIDTAQEWLSDYVGNRLRSIHQFLVVKAPNMEALDTAELYLDRQCRMKTLVFKDITLLKGENLYHVLRSVYGSEGVRRA